MATPEENKEDPKVIQAFDPNIAELTAMVETTKDLTATDLEDKAQLEVVRASRIALKTARVKIEKAGLAARDEANKFAKAVIGYEKKLIGIIEPEEDRLKAIEEEAEKLAIKKERAEKLPVRKERIEKAGLSFFHDKTDDEMLELDANAFEAYFNELGARKIEHDAAQKDMEREAAAKLLADEAAKTKAEQDAKAKELADKEAALAEERRQLDHEKEVEAAKKETEARVKAEQEAEQKRIAEAKKAEDERIAAEKKAADEKAAADKKAADLALAKKAKYQAFLKEMGMTKDNVAEFHKEETETEIVVYKKVGSYKK